VVLRDFLRGDMLDIGLPGIQLGHLLRVGVETLYLVPQFSEAQRQRESHVSATDDAHLDSFSCEEFGRPSCGHGGLGCSLGKE
jgi:hypothetical protein